MTVLNGSPGFEVRGGFAGVEEVKVIREASESEL